MAGRSAAPESESPIRSLLDLKTGDHIVVGGRLKLFYGHHLLVVRVIDENRLLVIHKLDVGFVEEARSYKPRQITVLNYECPYDGEEIIRRARVIFGDDEDYGFLRSNCEHFVREARTGIRSSPQVQRGMKGVLIGIAGGAATGAGVGFLGGPLGAAVGVVVGGAVGGLGLGIGGVVIGAASSNNA